MARRSQLHPNFSTILDTAIALQAEPKSQTLRDSYYQASYPSLCEAASVLCLNPTPNTLYALCNLAYGWMPTTPQHVFRDEIRANYIKFIASALNAKNAGDALNFLENFGTTAPFNNSWVGTSKVLHFINPDIFPIWDSKIARHYGIKTHATYNQRPKYMTYVIDAHNWANEPALATFQAILTSNSQHSITKIRATEYALLITSPTFP